MTRRNSARANGNKITALNKMLKRAPNTFMLQTFSQGRFGEYAIGHGGDAAEEHFATDQDRECRPDNDDRHQAKMGDPEIESGG